MTDTAETSAPEEKSGKKKMANHTKILLGLLLGAVAGILASVILGPEDESLQWVIRNITQPLGNLWLRLLLMIVVPLVFSALILGIAGLGNVKKLGRIGIKTLAYTL